MRPTFQLYQGTGAATEAIPRGTSPASFLQPLLMNSVNGFAPQQLGTAYGASAISWGAVKGDGTGQTIAIVDAYDDPNLVDSTSPNFSTSDLAQFDKQFGLPDPPSFTKIAQDGSTNLPRTDGTGNWEIEEALDVEWAHAMAPGASIVLVECSYPSDQDLMSAGVQTAAALPGVSVVSMSFGSDEWPSETSFDNNFITPSGHQGVTFLASTGDSGAPGGYPAYSPNVVAVGGTSLSLGTGSSYGSEAGWSDGGGGTSSYESEPAYQEAVQSTGHRTIPDVAFDADPNTGVPVYDSLDRTSPWLQVGGTSLAAPCWAGLIAIANQGRVAAGGTTLDGPSQTLPALYSLSSSDFHDITSGSNGNSAAPGYDQVTGLGTPQANLLVPALAGYQVASTLEITSEPPASVQAGTPFGLTVEACDSSGNLISSFNGTVIITLQGGPAGSRLSGTLSAAAVNGIATFSGLSLDAAGNGYALQTSSSGLSAASSTLIVVTPGAATHLVISSQPPGSVAAGANFRLSATAYDAFGNVASSDNGSVSLTVASGPSGGVLNGTLHVSASNGVVNFAGLTLNVAGQFTFTVSSGSLSSATTSLLNVTPGAAAHLTLSSPPPASLCPGQLFGVTATFEDSFGNVATGFSGAVNLSLASSPPGGALAGTLTANASAGLASFSNLAIDLAGAGYTLQVTSGSLSASSASIVVNVVQATRLVVVAQPSADIVAGTSFGVSVYAEDNFGNLTASFGGTVNVALVNNGSSQLLGGPISLTASQGTVTFSGLAIETAGSGYSLQIEAAGLTSATTSAFSVLPAAASSVQIIAAPPASTQAGVPFGLTAVVLDPFGNVVINTSVPLSVTVASGPSGSAVTVQQTLFPSQGIAAFSDLVLDRAGITTLEVSSPGLSPATTQPVDVLPATASQLLVAAQPPSIVTAGNSFALSVVAADRFGNIATGFGGYVTLGLASGPAGGVLRGPLSALADQGVAVFSGLTLDTAGIGYTLEASSAGTSPAFSLPVSVTPAVPAWFRVISSPGGTVTAGGNFQVSVIVQDRFGNLDTSYNGPVTVSLAKTRNNGRLRGNLVTQAIGGVAAFTNLSVSATGKGYVLVVSGASLPPVKLSPLSVINPPKPPKAVHVSTTAPRIVQPVKKSR